jgi:hypothetical protein
MNKKCWDCENNIQELKEDTELSYLACRINGIIEVDMIRTHILFKCKYWEKMK